MMAYALSLFTLIFTVLLIFLKDEIQTTIVLVKTATMVIKDVPIMMIWPFTTILAEIALFIYIILVGAFIITSKPEKYADMMDKVNSTDVASGAVSGSANDFQRFCLIVHFFGFLWTANFFLGVGTTVIACVAANWYFYRNAEDVDGEPNPNKAKWKMILGLRMVVRYHLGSIAFGSLIIAIIQMLRVVLEYIDRKTKEAQGDSCLLRLTMKCCKYCMWCLEKTVKFITSLSYIYVAINGDSFCKACRSTFGLLLKYPGQTAICKAVEKVLVMISCTVIPLCATLIFYADATAKGYKNAIYGCMLVFAMGLIISRAFGVVFETTCSTLFLSAFQDKDEYQGKFMTPELKDCLNIPDDDDGGKPEAAAAE